MENQEINIENKYLPLLQSINENRKYLHMGNTPVKAIELAWHWEDLGLIYTDDEGFLNITDKGKTLLK